MSANYPPTQVGRWMSGRLETIAPGAALLEARMRMDAHRIRHLPVVEEGRLVGLLTSRDLARVASEPSPRAGYQPLSERTAREVMTPAERLHVVRPESSVRAAAEQMCREKISALPVVEGGRLVGLVTSEDLLWSFLEGAEEGGR